MGSGDRGGATKNAEKRGEKSAKTRKRGAALGGADQPSNRSGEKAGELRKVEGKEKMKCRALAETKRARKINEKQGRKLNFLFNPGRSFLRQKIEESREEKCEMIEEEN